MSGPIVRTGTTPRFWNNWDRIFGDDTASETKSKKGKKAASKSKTEKKKKSNKK